MAHKTISEKLKMLANKYSFETHTMLVYAATKELQNSILIWQANDSKENRDLMIEKLANALILVRTFEIILGSEKISKIIKKNLDTLLDLEKNDEINNN